MTWTEPTIWAAGDPLTADRLNTQVKDNLQHLYAHVNSYTVLRDEKVGIVGSGAFTAGSWQTRVLNTEEGDAEGNVSLSVNKFTLVPGTYIIHASAPAHRVNYHQTRLQNVTDDETVAFGQSAYAHSGYSGNTSSDLATIVTITSSTEFELQHKCATTNASAGLGVNTTFSDSTQVFATVEIWRVA